MGVFGVRNGNIPLEKSVLISETPCSDSVCHGMPPPWSVEEYRHFNEGGSITVEGLPPVFTPGLTYELTFSISGGQGLAYGYQLAAIYDDQTQAGDLTPITQGIVLRDYAHQGFPVSFLSHASPLTTDTNPGQVEGSNESQRAGDLPVCRKFSKWPSSS